MVAGPLDDAGREDAALRHLLVEHGRGYAQFRSSRVGVEFNAPRQEAGTQKSLFLCQLDIDRNRIGRLFGKRQVEDHVVQGCDVGFPACADGYGLAGQRAVVVGDRHRGGGQVAGEHAGRQGAEGKLHGFVVVVLVVVRSGHGEALDCLSGREVKTGGRQGIVVGAGTIAQGGHKGKGDRPLRIGAQLHSHSSRRSVLRGGDGAGAEGGGDRTTYLVILMVADAGIVAGCRA